jgi:hypothetical protein
LVRGRTYRRRGKTYRESVTTNFQEQLMTPTRTTLRTLRAAATCLALSCAGTASWAADTGAAAQAQAQYRQDMAMCNSGRSNQDATTCRLEVRNALAEARRGGLVSGAPETYLGNALQRCMALKGIDRSACEGRMQGQGTVQGSVLGGGILRESTTTVPAN